MGRKKPEPKRQLTQAEALREAELRRGRAYAALAEAESRRSMRGGINLTGGYLFWKAVIGIIVSVAIFWAVAM